MKNEWLQTKANPYPETAHIEVYWEKQNFSPRLC